MKKYLIYDWETTGTLVKREPLHDPRQPRGVSLAAMLIGEDGRNLHTMQSIIRPDGFVIPAEATAIHGISHEFALEVGLPIKTVLHYFDHLCAHGDELIAFNSEFDSSLSIIEHIKLDRSHYMLADKLRCAMLPWKDILRIPGNYGDFKWPSLDEICMACGIKRDKAHDSLADVKTTVWAWFELKRRGVV